MQGPWKEPFEYIDAYANNKTTVEGSSVFKLNNSEEYILMYDLYSSGRYEFQRSRDLSHFTEKPESFTKDFNPRHGSVIGITQNEFDKLKKKWLNIQEGPKVFESHGNPIFTHKYTADPAALVIDNTLWLYTGHDFEGGKARL
ncbi:hypothetical protein [Thalassobellus suaedae]|uniref:Uncharacterized protein n=1 Tax=Thalassobellus suaedae TaxID=3074124 RepID=A0ABY9XXJ7_9FLAO|nr:hypothetical protein RHP51_08140 [Flavobacteriaceae bacterium HL-DH14]